MAVLNLEELLIDFFLPTQDRKKAADFIRGSRFKIVAKTVSKDGSPCLALRGSRKNCIYLLACLKRHPFETK